MGRRRLLRPEGRSSFKGQMVFEFIVATIVFIMIVFAVVAMLNSTVSSFTGNYYRNHINEEAMRVSELLTHSRGIWNAVGGSGVPELLGLAVEWPVLNDTEIKYLLTYCTGSPVNQDVIMSQLGLKSRGGAQGFRIKLSNASQVIIDCGTGTSYLEQGYAERFAYSGGSGLLKLGVYVW